MTAIEEEVLRSCGGTIERSLTSDSRNSSMGAVKGWSWTSSPRLRFQQVGEPKFVDHTPFGAGYTKANAVWFEGGALTVDRVGIGEQQWGYACLVDAETGTAMPYQISEWGIRMSLGPSVQAPR